MYSKIKKFIDNYIVKDRNKKCTSYCSIAVFPLLMDIPIVSRIATAMFSMGMILILGTTVENILKRVKEKNIDDESADSMELKNSEINEMLSYRITTRVIVPIINLDEDSISAIRFAKTISDDVTVFGICDNMYSCKEIEDNFKLLDTDIKVIIKHLTSGNATEQLLEFIESAEYSYTYGGSITIILPRSAVYKRLANLLQDQTKLYIKRELVRYDNIVVMTVS